MSERDKRLRVYCVCYVSGRGYSYGDGVTSDYSYDKWSSVLITCGSAAAAKRLVTAAFGDVKMKRPRLLGDAR